MTVIEIHCPTCQDTWHYLGTLADARTECRDCGGGLEATPTEGIPA